MNKVTFLNRFGVCGLDSNKCDSYFRKPFLAVCMAGKIVGAIFNLLNAIFLDSWSRWVWLATVMPIQNISGGYLTFIMMTYSFIADNSTNR